MIFIIISCVANVVLGYLFYSYLKKSVLLEKRKQYYKNKYRELKDLYFNQLDSGKIKKLYREEKEQPSQAIM